LGCVSLEGIIHLDSLYSSQEIYFGSLIAIKILQLQQQVGFVVKTKQLGNAYHFVGNDLNKMVGIALLIALVGQTLNQSIFLAPSG
jgi:hypothetical protein